MHLTLTLVAIVPALLIIGLMIWAVAGIARTIREKRPIRAAHCIAVLVFLLAVDTAASFAVLVSSWLSHSEEAKARAPIYCLVLFVFLVLLPTSGLTWLYKRAKGTVKIP